MVMIISITDLLYREHYNAKNELHSLLGTLNSSPSDVFGEIRALREIIPHPHSL